MIYSYCKKCKLESPGDTCQSCGKRAGANAQRDVWSIASLPVADGRIWRGTLLTLFCVAALLLAVIFGLNALIPGDQPTPGDWRGSVTRLVLAVFPAGLIVVFLFLLLQGREVNVYVLDPQGAHMQTWHTPSRIKSWARLQSADPDKNVRQQDGSVMHLSQERHLLWQDAVNLKYKPGSGLIQMYHTPHLAPLVLKLPANEYETAAAYVGKYCKSTKQ